MADRRLVTEDTTVGELLDLLADRGVTTVTLNLKHREDGTFGRVRLAAQPVIALDRAIRLLALNKD